MTEQRNQRQIQCCICDARVGCEDGKNSSQRTGNKQRLLVQSNGEAGHIRCRVQPEDAKEELAEGVEHLNEEVPPEAHVWGKVWQQQTDAICGSQKVPRSCQESRCYEEHAAHDSQAQRMRNCE